MMKVSGEMSVTHETVTDSDDNYYQWLDQMW